MSKSSIVLLCLWVFAAGFWFGERSMMKKSFEDMLLYQTKLRNCIAERIK